MKSKNITRYFFLVLNIFALLPVLNFWGINSNNVYLNLNINNKNQDTYDQSLKSSECVEELNITLQQSYLNSTAYVFENLSNQNSFYAPCPTEPTFNSSYTEIIIEDIIAPNKTLNIELGTSLNAHLSGSSDNTYAFSFEVEESCYLENFSMCFSENHADTDDGNIEVYLFSAQESGGSIIPLTRIETLEPSYIIENDIDETLFNFIGYHKYLNTSETYNNTFFITVYQSSNPLHTRVEFHYMSDTTGDQLDSSLVYESASSSTIWYLENWDAFLIVDLSPIDNKPSPSQINLKINNSAVNDYIFNSGYWNSIEEYTSSTGLLKFELSSNWSDIYCMINKVQINYTKTDLKAESNYTNPEKDLYIWNATIDQEISCFDQRIQNYNKITFLVPANWSEIKAFYGSIKKPVIISTSLINGYKGVTILEAGNGSNWHLTAIVDNRLPQNGEGAIPFDNYFVIILVISTISLVYIIKKKSIFHENEI